jgi:hypothetical protein
LRFSLLPSSFGGWRGKAGNYGVFAADVEGAGSQLAMLVIKRWRSPVLAQAER